jgi:hypothetical protein
MTEAVYQFKSIKRILDRQEQKAEFEEKNPPAGFIRTISGALVHVDDAMTRPHGMAVPLMDQMGSTEAGRLTGGLSPAVRAFVDGWEYDESLRMWRKYEI